MKRIHLLISGKVQGVFFRANTEKKAKELGVTGFVKNLKDGRVEIIAEGKEEKLTELIEFCKRCDFGAYVENVEAKWGGCTKEFIDFRAEY